MHAESINSNHDREHNFHVLFKLAVRGKIIHVVSGGTLTMELVYPSSAISYCDSLHRPAEHRPAEKISYLILSDCEWEVKESVIQNIFKE